MTPAALKWLKANGHDLGPLTGQDTRALVAIADCWDLYASADEDGSVAAIEAIRWLLTGMQPKCRPLAKELVARSLDWDDRERLWTHVNAEVRP